MREIKFRVWDTKDKSMVMNPLGFPELYPTNELMQYTGLKDKNGVEIYEGDIVKIWTAGGFGYVAEVQFNDGCFDVVHEWRDYLKVYVGNHSVEVIGSIHEKPELLADREEV